MIRYVDSSGWTWAVCELADRPQPGAEAASVAPAERTPPLAERRLTLAPMADAPPDPAAAATDADDDAAVADSGELYFFSRLGTRKLRGYPARWASLPRTGLEALCARARDVGMDNSGAYA